MFDPGLTIFDVQERLGHHSPTVTAEVYTHEVQLEARFSSPTRNVAIAAQFAFDIGLAVQRGLGRSFGRRPREALGALHARRFAVARIPPAMDAGAGFT